MLTGYILIDKSSGGQRAIRILANFGGKKHHLEVGLSGQENAIRVKIISRTLSGEGGLFTEGFCCISPQLTPQLEFRSGQLAAVANEQNIEHVSNKTLEL